MAIKTPANLTPPPNSGEPQGDGVQLYRKWERSVTDDGQGEVNFADTICKLNDPNSGEAINVTFVSPVTAPITNFRATTFTDRKVLFETNFDSGFDTLNDLHCVFDDSLVAESRNASEASANGLVFVNTSESHLAMQVAADGPVQQTILLESKNYVKIRSSGVTYLEGQGIFEHAGNPTSNTTTFGVFDIGGFGPASISRPNWNVDTFGAGVLNPSEITLDFKNIQTAVFQYSGKNKGDVKFGFLVDDTLYFAHIFSINNFAPETKTLNLPVRDTMSVSASPAVSRTFGLHNTVKGFAFGSIMDTTIEPDLLVQQQLNNVVCYTVGADPVEKKIPFVIGNKETYIDVSAADTPLFSMQCAAAFKGGINRSVFNFDSLRVHASSQDPNFGCYIKVLYNTTLGGVPNFVAIPDNAESALEYDLAATSVAGGIEIFSIAVMANQVVEFSAEDIFKNYRNEFSRADIEGLGITTQVQQQTLTVIASPMQGVINTTSIDVSANIFGGEVG